METTPKLSVLVVFHRMSRQAENTLHSISVAFQNGMRAEDYEVVAVENVSNDVLGRERATAACPNVRYFLREEMGRSPMPAAAFALAESRAPYVGLLLDGANLLTPRTLETALLARKLFSNPVVAVPGYHLGDRPQHLHASARAAEESEQRQLVHVDWKRNGYALFDVASASPAFEKGFFNPFLEASCLFATRESLERMGGADLRFGLEGGGQVCAFLYGELMNLPEARLVVLAGEGTFHQFHGGVTTSASPDREDRVRIAGEHLEQISGRHPYARPPREPFVLGVFPPQCMPFLEAACDAGVMYHAICRELGQLPFPLDP